MTPMMYIMVQCKKVKEIFVIGWQGAQVREVNLLVHVVVLISLFLVSCLCFAGICFSLALREVHCK